MLRCRTWPRSGRPRSVSRERASGRHGFRESYEVAVVISNDSDLVLPIQIVRDELKLPVGVVNPRGHPSRELLAVSSFFKRIRPGLLQASQFPEALEDEQGTISKPAVW